MAEEILLAAPFNPDPGGARFRISQLILDWDNSTVSVRLRDWTGASFGSREIFVVYSGPGARAQMTALNKVDLSVKSLHQRLLERLAADGKLPAGTITGAPE